MAEAIRRFAFWLIPIPAAILLMAFALANRQRVFLYLNPFSVFGTGGGTELPLFFICFLFLVLGALLGAFITWNTQRPWRAAVRRQVKEIEALRDEINEMKHSAATPTLEKLDWQILPPL